MFPVSEERLSQRKAITDAEIQREAITKDAVFDVVRRNLTVVSRRNDVVLVEQLTRRANWNWTPLRVCSPLAARYGMIASHADRVPL